MIAPSRGATRHRPRQGRSPASSRPGARRCAVYTRKSSEEGLEQEYNSLHAQREACEAYIRSQQHEGWILVPTAYDDGGISGGTMDRPALQALLAEIRAGRVDVIVVYKVDRLTRSLADFAKMVELFDATGASFVAVTQQFNTTTSMGRLTLNVLLSFAQFEREVTGERIRDKIAASKRKGMWMGGRTPLGYAVRDRKLVVVPEDAAAVVELYRRYLAAGSVGALKAELDGQGITSKRWTSAGGTEAGGTRFSRGALYALLSNPIYLGQVRHKGECHPGQHAAIVPDALFAAVQARLASSNNGQKGRVRAKVEPSLLAGKLFDEAGERLVPSHARKGERRYRYYVSAHLIRAGRTRVPGDAVASASSGDPQDNAPAAKQFRQATNPQSWRLPARDIEQNVGAAMLAILNDAPALLSDALAAGLPPAAIPALQQALRHLPRSGSDLVDHIVKKVVLYAEGMMLMLQLPAQAQALAQATAASAGDEREEAKRAEAKAKLSVSRFVPHRVRRRGVEMRLVLEGGPVQTREDPALLKVVARARCWFEDLANGSVASAHDLAGRLGVTSRYVQRLLPLAFLAPALVEKIVAGQHDAGLKADALTERGTLPLRWSAHADHLS